MGNKFDKTIRETNRLRLFNGDRKRDIYDDAKWKKRRIDIDGETWEGSVYDPMEEQWEEEKLRSKAKEIVNPITTDPIEHSITELTLETYAEKEIAEILNINLARVEWFMRKIAEKKPYS
jgi:hypothetical protein